MPIALLAFAGKPSSDGASEPFEVIRAGKFTRGGREIEITEPDLDRMLDNFKRWQSMGAEVPVDYDHSFFEKGDSKAAGWYTELVRKGRSLFARVKWTKDAVEKIASGEYKFFSPEWTHNWINEEGESEGPTMLAGGLTNRPFLRGMTPVALSQEVAAEAWSDLGDQIETMAAAVAAHLKPDSAERDETHGNVSKDTDIKAADAPAAETSAQERKPEQVTMNRSEVTELREKASQAETFKTKLDESVERIGSLEKSVAAERFAHAFGQAQREGRVDAKPETREKWAGRVERFGLEATKELLSELPAETIPVTERGRAGEAPEASADVPENTDEQAFQVDVKARELMAADKDLSYVAAVDKIEAELDKAAS